MKEIRENLRQKEIEQALIDTANVLKQTFRRSDIIGHIGIDDFAVVALEAHKENAEIIIARLHKTLDIINTKENRDHKLSLSIGTAFYDPTSPCSITGLMTWARKSLRDGK
jgi:diguanylate cyclase (GGDEF)-like protein